MNTGLYKGSPSYLPRKAQNLLSNPPYHSFPKGSRKYNLLFLSTLVCARTAWSDLSRKLRAAGKTPEAVRSWKAIGIKRQAKRKKHWMNRRDPRQRAGNNGEVHTGFPHQLARPGVLQRQQGWASPVAVTVTPMTSWPQSHPACLGTRKLVCRARMS